VATEKRPFCKYVSPSLAQSRDSNSLISILNKVYWSRSTRSASSYLPTGYGPLENQKLLTPISSLFQLQDDIAIIIELDLGLEYQV
jgi:hypothetical protein